MKQKIAIMLAIVLFVGVLAACRDTGNIHVPRQSNAGTSAPSGPEDDEQSTGWINLPIDTVDLYGAAVTDADFSQNELTMLNVWGTWCPPCVRELPELQEISEDFAERGVQVVGVLQDGVTESGAPVDETIQNALKLLEDAGVNYPVILPDETLMAEFVRHMHSFPTTFFIDSGGNVVHTVIGAKDFEGWSEEINEILDELSQ